MLPPGIQTTFNTKIFVWFVVLILLSIFLGTIIGVYGLVVFVAFIIILLAITMILLSIFFEQFPIYLLVASLPLAELLRIQNLPSTLLIVPGGLAIVSLISSLMLRKNKVIVFSPIMIPALLLGIWAVIVAVKYANIGEVRPYLLVVLLIFLIPNLLKTERHLLAVSWLWVISLGVAGLYVFLDRLIFYLQGEAINAEVLHAVVIRLGDKNVVGMWLSMGLPFVISLISLYKNQPHKRFWLLFFGTFMIIGALSTISIGVFLGLLIVVVLMILLHPNKRVQLGYLLVITLLITVGFIGPIGDRLRSQRLLTLDDSWGTYRVALWKAGFNTLLDNPLFGVGLDVTRRIQAMTKYLNVPFLQYWITRGVLIAPHNNLLSVGVELGLPGLLLYTLFIITLLYVLLAIRRMSMKLSKSNITLYSNIFFISLTTGLIQGLALSEHLSKQIWFLGGCTIALYLISKNKTNV